MSIIDVIEAPIKLGIDGLFSIFEPGKKGAIRSSGGNRGISRSPKFSNNTFGSNTANKSKKTTKNNQISVYTREGLNLMEINAKKARKNLSGLKTGYKPKNNNIFSGLK